MTNLMVFDSRAPCSLAKYIPCGSISSGSWVDDPEGMITRRDNNSCPEIDETVR